MVTGRMAKSRMANRLLGSAGGLIADMVLGEPPIRPHPVAAFGSLMGQVEGRLYGDERRRGVAHAGIGVVVGGLAGWLLRSTAAATYLAVAERGLTSAALEVADAIERKDLDAARGLLLSLVGRDTEGLDETEIARAAIESVAENAVDAIVAPALWGAAGGAAAALAYRAANTMDASVGYRNERYGRYGWAAASLDDAANYLPARVTAGLVVAVRPSAARAILAAIRRDAPAHPSPNSGVAEAAFAAALGIELGGTSSYAGHVEHRPILGRGRPPRGDDIGRAVRLCRHVTLALAAALAAAGGALARTEAAP